MDTGILQEAEIIRFLKKNVDLTPKGIINRLKLQNPLYQLTAAYGHFGRELSDFAWEKTDLALEIAKL